SAEMVALARGLEHGVHGPMAVADLERRFDRMRDESFGCPGCSQRLQASSQPCRDRSRERAPAAVRVRSVDAASGQLGHLVAVEVQVGGVAARVPALDDYGTRAQLA